MKNLFLPKLLLASAILLQCCRPGICSTTESSSAESTEYYEEEAEIPTTCSDGDVYRTIEECLQECWQIHENRTIAHPAPKTESGAFRYKVVELSGDEFEVTSGNFLTTKLPNKLFPQMTYSLDEDKAIAHVCYPLQQDFIQCEQKWGIPLDEVSVENNSRVIWANAYNKYYQVGEFYIDAQFDEVVTCVHEDTVKHQKISKAMASVLVTAFVISATSLIFCFILSITVAELNIRNNKILLSHMLILSFAYWTLVIQESLPETILTDGCKALAFFKQFSILSSFFWINVQAIDLFIRFVNLRGQSLDRKGERNRFIAYSAYAWGGPLVISTVTTIMDHEEPSAFHPNFSPDNNCWFNFWDKITMFVYFYGPMALILLANVVLFILTVYKLTTVSKNASNVNKKLQNQLLQLYLKLVIVMGLCWIMEIISWAVGGDDRHWYFTDLINALQGLVIFIVYVCKPSLVRRFMYKNSFFPNRPKWWPWKGAGPTADHADGTKTRATISTTSSLAATECQNPNQTPAV